MHLPFTRDDAAADFGPAPELLVFDDGTPVRTPDDWSRRRVEVYEKIIVGEYGGMPPVPPPGATSPEVVSTAAAGRRCGIDGSEVAALAIAVDGGAEPLRFAATLWTPPGDGPFPVVVNGDGCWSYLTDAVVADVLRHGFALVSFNRCEIARDRKGARDRGIYRAFPGGYGALSAWAWGYHRVLDALAAFPRVDASRAMVTGHSRGGKTVELAGATDERIAMVADNNSGCGGFGCFRVRGKGAETIGDITGNFPFWFAEGFGGYAGREAELPFDQHFLAALVAPRVLRMQVAFGDTWSNPVGACETYRLARPVYDLLGAGGNFQIVFREGGHGHEPEDWAHSLDAAALAGL